MLLPPAIAEVAVVGAPDPTWGESVVAAVVFKSDCSATQDELTEHCRAHIAGDKRPKYYQFLEAMPRVPSTNKIDKRALRAPLWKDKTRQVS